MGDRSDDEPPRAHEPISHPSREADAAGWYKMAGIGFEFVAAIALFGGIGYFLDGRLGTSPWLLITGFGLGFAAGLSLMYKAARKSFK